MNIILPKLTFRACDEFRFEFITPADAPTFCEALKASWSELSPWLHFGQMGTPTPDSVRQYLEEQSSLLRNLQEFHFGIYDASDNFLGAWTYHLNGRALSMRVAEISLWLRSDQAARGLGHRVLEKIVEWGFSDWPWLRLEWHCDERNIPSRKTAAKAGFTVESHAHQSMRNHQGRWINTLVFARNKYPREDLLKLPFSYRPLARADLNRAGQIFADAMHDQYQHILPFHAIAGINGRSAAMALHKKAGQPHKLWLGAFQSEGVLLGFLTLDSVAFSGEAVCHGLYVPLAYHGAGIGMGLIEAVKTHLPKEKPMLVFRHPKANDTFARFLKKQRAILNRDYRNSQWDTEWIEWRLSVS